MKKTLVGSTLGLGLATVAGMAGLPHLSASLVTLTTFCAAPALLILALSTQPNALRKKH